MGLDDALGVFRDFERNLATQGMPLEWHVVGEIGGDARVVLDNLSENVELRGTQGSHGVAWSYHCLGAHWEVRTVDELRRLLHGLGYTTRPFMEVPHA